MSVLNQKKMRRQATPMMRRITLGMSIFLDVVGSSFMMVPFPEKIVRLFLLMIKVRGVSYLTGANPNVALKSL